MNSYGMLNIILNFYLNFFLYFTKNGMLFTIYVFQNPGSGILLKINPMGIHKLIIVYKLLENLNNCFNFNTYLILLLLKINIKLFIL